jgi:Ca2+-binding EF-hand superfamily protein
MKFASLVLSVFVADVHGKAALQTGDSLLGLASKEEPVYSLLKVESDRNTAYDESDRLERDSDANHRESVAHSDSDQDSATDIREYMRVDTNQDLMLSKEEFLQGASELLPSNLQNDAMLKRLFIILDADHDGRVEPSEYKMKKSAVAKLLKMEESLDSAFKDTTSKTDVNSAEDFNDQKPEPSLTSVAAASAPHSTELEAPSSARALPEVAPLAPVAATPTHARRLAALPPATIAPTIVRSAIAQQSGSGARSADVAPAIASMIREATARSSRVSNLRGEADDRKVHQLNSNANQDIVSNEDFMMAAKALLPPGPLNQDYTVRFFNILDTNHDGDLDRVEFQRKQQAADLIWSLQQSLKTGIAAGRARQTAPVPAHRHIINQIQHEVPHSPRNDQEVASRFQQLDKNGDGRLDPSEFRGDKTLVPSAFSLLARQSGDDKTKTPTQSSRDPMSPSEQILKAAKDAYQASRSKKETLAEAATKAGKVASFLANSEKLPMSLSLQSTARAAFQAASFEGEGFNEAATRALEAAMLVADSSGQTRRQATDSVVHGVAKETYDKAIASASDPEKAIHDTAEAALKAAQMAKLSEADVREMAATAVAKSAFESILKSGANTKAAAHAAATSIRQALVTMGLSSGRSLEVAADAVGQASYEAVLETGGKSADAAAAASEAVSSFYQETSSPGDKDGKHSYEEAVTALSKQVKKAKSKHHHRALRAAYPEMPPAPWMMPPASWFSWPSPRTSQRRLHAFAQQQQKHRHRHRHREEVEDGDELEDEDSDMADEEDYDYDTDDY